MVCQLILLIAILLSGCVSISFAQPQPIRFVDERSKTLAQAEVVEHGGGLYFSIQTLQDAFDPGMKQQYSSLTKRLTLNLKGKQLRLRIGSLSVSVDSGEIELSLSRPPVIVEGERILPLAFFIELIPQVYDFDVFYNDVIQTIHITERTALLPNSPSSAPTGQPAEFRVILDPGHGGTDKGCRGSTRVAEKDIVLALAKQIEAVARQNQVEVLLTREADFDLRRSERIEIATKNQGKLFLSLHCNASFSDQVEGIHLYLNNSLGGTQSGRPSTEPDETSQDSPIIEVLSQEEFLIQSRQFAKILQAEFETFSPSPISLTEIPLATLAGVYMPAVLVEIGYLSNEADEARLTDADNLAFIAAAIVQAIRTYVAEPSAESNQVEEAANGR